MLSQIYMNCVISYFLTKFSHQIHWKLENGRRVEIRLAANAQLHQCHRVQPFPFLELDHLIFQINRISPKYYYLEPQLSEVYSIVFRRMRQVKLEEIHKTWGRF